MNTSTNIANSKNAQKKTIGNMTLQTKMQKNIDINKNR